VGCFGIGVECKEHYQGILDRSDLLFTKVGKDYYSKVLPLDKHRYVCHSMRMFRSDLSKICLKESKDNSFLRLDDKALPILGISHS
jgi:hypothetical protein